MPLSGVYTPPVASGGSTQASGISFTPAGNVASTDVQAAIAEVDSEKAAKASNLSDLASASTARTNLGLGTSATQAAMVPTSKTATYTAVDGDIVLADASGGAFAVTLPAVSSGRRVTVKKTDSSTNAVTVSPASGTIDGLSTRTLTSQYQTDTYVADGTNWHVVGRQPAIAGGPSYNMLATVFRRHRKALSKVRIGTAREKIMCIGDSTMAGVGGTSPDVNSMPALLASLLNSYYVPAALNFATPNCGSGVTADSRVTASGNWSRSANLAGFGLAGNWLNTSGSGTLPFTPTGQTDTLEIGYIRNTSLGTFTVNVDGGSTLATVNTSGTASVQVATVSTTLGSHTWNIVDTSGSVYLYWVRAYNSAVKQVDIANFGQGGVTTADWTTTTFAFSSIGAITAFAPDLSIISLGINDAGASASAATYQSRLTTLINTCLASGDVLLMSPVPSNGSPYTTFEPQYVSVDAALAPSLGTGFLDMAARWVSYTAANADGYYSDSLHPSGFGYADWAQATFNALKTI